MTAFLRSDVFDQLFCCFFLDGILHIQYAHLDGSRSKSDLNLISNFDIHGCFCNLAIYQNTSCITGFICNGAALDQAGNL